MNLFSKLFKKRDPVKFKLGCSYNDAFLIHDWNGPYRIGGFDLDEISDEELMKEYEIEQKLGKYYSESKCIFCANSTVTKRFKQYEWHDVADMLGLKVARSKCILRLCNYCGWWEFSNSIQAFEHHSYSITGIAKKYDISDNDIPIEILRGMLSGNSEKLADLNPNKFEEVIASCLKDFYNPCEVRIIGKQGHKDRGIDLIVIKNNKKDRLVQVKRRINVNKNESVEVVRSLNGVLFREGINKGMVVTTAIDFTKDAKKEIKDVKYKNYHMELFGLNEVLTILDIKQNEDPYEPFKKFSHLIDKPFDKHRYGTFNDTLGDEYKKYIMTLTL